VIEDLMRKFAYYQLRHMIMAGTLDSVKGMGNLDMDQFNQNLAEILRICRSHNVQLVFLMPGADGEDSNTPLHPFQKSLFEFAAKEHVPLVNMIPVLSGKSSLFMDQVHPTAAGNEVIASELFKTVEGCEGSPTGRAHTGASRHPLVRVATDRNCELGIIANLFMDNNLTMDSGAIAETFFHGPQVLLQDLALSSTLDLSSCRRLRISPVHDLDVVSRPSGLRATCISQTNGVIASRNVTQRAKL
jgi:hypothetical protein